MTIGPAPGARLDKIRICAPGWGVAEKSTRRQNWGRKLDFLPFVKCNIEREDEEGSGVSLRLGCEDEVTVSKGDKVEGTEDKRNKISIYSIGQVAEKGIFFG